MPKTTIPIEQLLADLHHQDFTIRCDAARELGKSRDPRAIQALLPDLNDEDWRIRRNAAQALGALKAKEAVDALIQALNDRTMTVRSRAAVALGRIKDPRAIPALVEALLHGKGEIIDEVGQALVKFGKAAIPALTEAFHQAPPERKMPVLRLLNRLPGTCSVELLAEMLGGPDPAIRYEAAHMLGLSRDEKAVEPLLHVLTDPDPMVKGAAASALSAFRDPRIVPALLDQLLEPALLGEYQQLYLAITRTLHTFSGIPTKYSIVLPNDLVWQLGSQDMGLHPQLQDLISGLGAVLHRFGSMFSPLEDETPAALQSGQQMFHRMQNAKKIAAAEVEELTGWLSAALPITRIAAAVCLPWYGNVRAREPLRIAAMDPDPDVRRAADWAAQALETHLSDQP